MSFSNLRSGISDLQQFLQARYDWRSASPQYIRLQQSSTDAAFDEGIAVEAAARLSYLRDPGQDGYLAER